MSKKKTSSKSKKTSNKPKKDIDINNIDAMIEDMKNLALEKTTEEEKQMEEVNEENTLEDVQNEETVVTEVVEEQEENESEIIIDNETEVELDNEENLGSIDNKVMTEEETFSEEIVEEMEEEKPKLETTAPKKPKRKTYQEMFGGSWRGYGYDHF